MSLWKPDARHLLCDADAYRHLCFKQTEQRYHQYFQPSWTEPEIIHVISVISLIRVSIRVSI